eukprot:6200076-Pleurochrysis_carterae.AAC.7
MDDATRSRQQLRTPAPPYTRFPLFAPLRHLCTSQPVPTSVAPGWRGRAGGRSARARRWRASGATGTCAASLCAP